MKRALPDNAAAMLPSNLGKSSLSMMRMPHTTAGAIHGNSLSDEHLAMMANTARQFNQPEPASAYSSSSRSAACQSLISQIHKEYRHEAPAPILFSAPGESQVATGVLKELLVNYPDEEGIDDSAFDPDLLAFALCPCPDLAFFRNYGVDNPEERERIRCEVLAIELANKSAHFKRKRFTREETDELVHLHERIKRTPLRCECILKSSVMLKFVLYGVHTHLACQLIRRGHAFYAVAGPHSERTSAQPRV